MRSKESNETNKQNINLTNISQEKIVFIFILTILFVLKMSSASCISNIIRKTFTMEANTYKIKETDLI